MSDDDLVKGLRDPIRWSWQGSRSRMTPSMALHGDQRPFEAADRIEALTARIAKLEEALRSIASNTCCDKCQEAALVASAALE